MPIIAWIVALCKKWNETMTKSERDGLILSVLEHVTPLLHYYAASSPLEFDDLYQDATITIIHKLNTKADRLQFHGTGSNVYGYMTVAVKHRIIDKLRYTKIRKAISIDAPVNGRDDTPTLADLLPSPYRTEPITLLLAQERIQKAIYSIPSISHHAARRVAQELGETALALASVEV